MNNIYPVFDRNSFKPLYYVEFDRDGEETFTLFKRNLIYRENEWEEIKKNLTPLMSMEMHPYNLFTGQYSKNINSTPNTDWVKWMVDKLNN